MSLSIDPAADGLVVADPTSADSPAGEVVESSSTDFVAQSCALDVAPDFGAWVYATAEPGVTVYGIVARVETTGIDSSARPVLRGHDAVRDHHIYLENPDLPLVLRTLFRMIVVGFESAGSLHQYLPARPPKLHYSVHIAPADAVRAFTDAGLDYLGTLLNAEDAPVDEIVAANTRLTGAIRGEPDLFARRVGRELARLMQSDYARLARILRRMAPPGTPVAPLRLVGGQGR